VSEHESHFTVWGFIKGFGKLIIGILLLIQGLIGLVVMLFFLGIFLNVMSGFAGNNDKPTMTIQDGSALLLNLNGVLVEQAEEVNPYEVLLEEAYGRSEPAQIEVHDVVETIRSAKTDSRIKAIVLDLGSLQVSSSSASKMHYIADELRAFKASGKPVIAVGDYYSQDQYLLAANADKIYMNDYGNLVIYGYGRYGTYMKSFLEKLKITSHVFRVGTFKSAVEPYIRDDMSPEAKEANRAYLDVLWREYVKAVETARGLPAGAVENYANNFGEIMRGVNGDMAQAALDTGLVDELKSRAEINNMLMDAFGKTRDGKSFKHVSYRRYLTSLDGPEDDADPNIAVVTVAGVIIDGEAPVGQAAGGDTVAAQLKKARLDDKVKAVVVRVDSPGGSAFASDIIRDEILAIKAAGKPVIASMGSLATSGGYWVSAPADEIWASPTTITGSIGIFGFFTTFENTAAEVGVFTDGVGTTSLSPIVATGIGPLPDNIADIIQQSTENGYDRFLGVVSEGRGMSKSDVDSIGQGRVWIGERAKDLRLVDKLGSYDEAIASAAALAKLEKYDVITYEDKRTPFEKMFLSGGASAKLMAMLGLEEPRVRPATGLTKLVKKAEEQIEFYDQFNDPNAIYARCITCE